MKKNILIILSLLLIAISGCGNGAGNTTSPVHHVSADTSPETSVSSETTALSLFTTTGGSVSVSATVSAAAEPAVPDTTTTERFPETSLLPEDYENEIVKTAEALIGIDFVQGGASPSDGFDNSGFIYYVLRKNGYVSCPRMIDEQIAWCENVGLDGIKPGDVLYFSGDNGTAAEFGGFYAGDGIMIYSPYPGEKVKKVDITQNYWVTHFVTAISL